MYLFHLKFEMSQWTSWSSHPGNVFLPDANFCRKCGAKRETVWISVRLPEKTADIESKRVQMPFLVSCKFIHFKKPDSLLCLESLLPAGHVFSGLSSTVVFSSSLIQGNLCVWIPNLGTSTGNAQLFAIESSCKICKSAEVAILVLCRWMSTGMASCPEKSLWLPQEGHESRQDVVQWLHVSNV